PRGAVAAPAEDQHVKLLGKGRTQVSWHRLRLLPSSAAAAGRSGLRPAGKTKKPHPDTRRPPPQSRMGLLHISPSQSISLCCHVYDTRPGREILARRAAHFAPAGSGGELPPDPPPSPAAGRGRRGLKRRAPGRGRARRPRPGPVA